MVIKNFDDKSRAKAPDRNKLTAPWRERSPVFKKILMLVLILHTSYTLPAEPSVELPGYGFTTILAAGGILCTWQAYKDFKAHWQACKEFNLQLTILNKMGVKVNKISKTEYSLFSNTITAKEHLAQDIPSNFSQEQKRNAKKHWNLLLTHYNAMNYSIRGWPIIGSLILVPLSICTLFAYIIESQKN